MAESYMGWEVELYAGVTSSETLVGKAQSCSFELSSDNTTVYGVGYRDPREIVEGQREVTGSIDHLIIDSTFFDHLNANTQPEWTIRAELDTGKKVELTGVKLNTWSLDIPQDDDLVESIDFDATSINWLSS